MNAAQTCPQCGAVLRDKALEGLCQDCLGRLVLGDSSALATSPASSAGIPTAGSNDGPGGPSNSQRGTAGLKRFGDYELIEEIAHGGMGVVYKARQMSLNRTVAVKMIRAGQFASKEFVHRFRVEASAAAVLQHPNIVAVHEVGVVEGQHFFSMDYVAGKNLAQIVREGPLPPNRAARYVQKIAEAIHYAHQSGILHRDLKPSNVLIDQNDQPRITDFGLAKQLHSESSATLTGEVLGTPGYMPPEQASGNRGAVKAWSDVYSLGAILYHLLTGRAPFAAGSLEETLNQVLHRDPVSVRLLNPAVPRDLDTICLKCLEKEPGKRYGSAQLLADELTRFLNHEPILARPISTAGKAWRWCRRKPALAAALGLLVVLAVGSPIAAFRINRARHLAEEHRELAEARLYGADMNLAAQALRDGSLGATKAILERHRKETNFTGFEWRYLWQRCRGDYEFSLVGHQGNLCKVAFSPDGRLLASRDYEHVLKVWDLATRQERLSLTNITGLAGFTPDGTGLILGVNDNAIAHCDVATGRITRRYEDLGEPLGLLADGRTLATTRSNFLVQYFDLPSGRETMRLSGAGGIWWGLGHERCFVSISGDGRYLVNCEDLWVTTNKVRFTVWDVPSRTRLATYEESFTNKARMTTHDRIQVLQMLPDSFTVAWGAMDRFVRFWQWTNAVGGLTVVTNRQAGVYSLAVSAGGQWFATGSSDETIKIWDRTTFRELALLRGHEDRVATLAISPDDRWLASGSRDRTVKIWNVRGQRAPTFLSGLAGAVDQNQPEFSPDGALVAVAMNDSTVALLNAATLQKVRSLTNSLFQVGFIKRGAKLVVVAATDPLKLETWDLATSTVDQTIRLEGLTAGNIGKAVLSPDGTQVAIAARGSAVRLVDLNTSRESARLPAAGDLVRGLGYSLNGELLMGTDEAGRVLFWDLKQKKLIRSIPGHSSVAFVLAVSPDGKVLATASKGQIRLWDVASGEPRGDFPAHRQSIFGLAFSPDGKTLASTSTDGTMKLWRLPLLQEVSTIPFSERPDADADSRFLRAAFAPDGNSLWAFTFGGELKVLRAAPWEEILREDNLAQRLPWK